MSKTDRPMHCPECGQVLNLRGIKLLNWNLPRREMKVICSGCGKVSIPTKPSFERVYRAYRVAAILILLMAMVAIYTMRNTSQMGVAIVALPVLIGLYIVRIMLSRRLLILEAVHEPVQPSEPEEQ